MSAPLTTRTFVYVTVASPQLHLAIMAPNHPVREINQAHTGRPIGSRYGR